MDELNSSVEKLDITNETEPIVKRKKGRPRKDATIQNVPKNPEEKKKRGRKKKEVVVEEVKQKKKRGRKAAVKYFSSSIRKKIPLTTVLQDNNNYILHLDVKDNNKNDDDDDNDNDDKDDDMINAFNDDNVVKPIESDKMHIDGIFEQLQKENDVNLNELQQEYDELLEKEDFIINEIVNNEDNLTELYERRIEYREHQDNQLINKLEILHKDSNLVDKIFDDDKTNIVQTEINEKDDCQEQNRKRGYFELLRDFVKNEDWLYKTDVCCWWCCHSFDSVPIGIPEKYDQRLKKFHVKGVFCSFSCMIAYKNETRSGYLKEYLIKFLYNKITGTLLLDANLEPAPPRCTLRMFGGELSIEEFRNSFKENRIYKMIDYPMYVSKDYIEEVDIQNVKRVNQNVFTDNLQQKVSNLDNKRIEDARIRLSQIEKTTITLGNTIDKFIKIT